ncbi:hypothetical protein ACM2UK_26155 [Escherichia coli]|uniref:hypothetical protein n=1 Tax=Escherichia coli TaxID=562 RepID=UPI001F1D4B5F|nr:hypothetical protein [Escherichia coli]MCE4383009.1 hypothetical protein [Escherichia coli]MDA5223446.1 hypothetical protein [Escherichia coli]MDN1557683.1 hypothetical protein [Escherichia coli]
MSIHDLCEDQEQWAMQTLMGSGVLARCRIHNDVILDSGNDASSAYKLGTYLYLRIFMKGDHSITSIEIG